MLTVMVDTHTHTTHTHTHTYTHIVTAVIWTSVTIVGEVSVVAVTQSYMKCK